MTSVTARPHPPLPPGAECVFPGCPWLPAYPAGYRDPPWQTPATFHDVVLPARRKAIQDALNAHLEDTHGITGVRWEWIT